MFAKESVRTLVLVITAAAASLVFPGCGGGDADSAEDVQALCRAQADATCEKLYECFTPSTLSEAGLPSTVSGCKALLRADAGCDAADSDDLCDGSEQFDRANAKRCVSQLETTSCKQIQSSDDRADYAPACDQVCVVR